MGFPQPPLQSSNNDASGKFSAVWQSWITRVQSVLNALTASGTSSGRPTQNLYIGQPYFDTSLNQIVWWNGSAWIKDAPATTGTSILSGDGNGGFTPVTIGTGLFYVGHTLSGTGGTLTSLSVATQNGFAGTVATPSTTPVITLSTTINGITYGDGTSLNAVTIGSGVSFAGGVLSATGSGGTVTAVSVATANGFAGTSSGGSTPALTLSTTVTGILQGNGTAISAASTTGTGSIVLASSPTISGDWGNFNSIKFNTTASVPTPTAGQLWWDGFGTLNMQMDSHVTAQLAETSYYYVKASAAVSIGDLCMFSGVVGASGVITVAPATGITNGQYIVGIAAESIALNGFGYIQNFGTLKGFNTTGSSVGETWADGDILYYNSSYAGKLTKVYPASGPIVTVAAVINAGSGGSGSVIIRPTVTQRITVSSPLSVTQNATSTSLSISQATTSTSGYLSSTDWNTFNNKASSTATFTLGSTSIALGSTTTSIAGLTLTAAAINGTVGATTASTGAFTTLTATEQLTLNGATSGTVAFVAPTVAGSQTYTLPTGTPGSTSVLQSDTAGNMSWVTNNQTILQSYVNLTLTGF